jgi:serine phosphatase RsbU (regulator of sigma subunit)
MPNSISLIRTFGPEHSDVPDRYDLDSDRVVGRLVESDICLPDQSVSRRHATILVRQGLWYIIDHGSTSGTLLNGRPLEPALPAELRGGDTLDIGPWRFRIRNESDSQTVALSREQPGVVEDAISARRLDALGSYLAALTHCETPEQLAFATIEAALAGTGFSRAVVLNPPDSTGRAPTFVVGMLRQASGVMAPIASGTFKPSAQLIARALQGRTARYAESAPSQTIDDSASLSSESIATAFCVPVTRSRGIDALLYLDTPSAIPTTQDPIGFLDDLCGLFAFALTSRANAESAKRQHAMQIEFEHAKDLRNMLSAPDVLGSDTFSFAHRTIAGMFVSADIFDIVHHPDGTLDVIFGDAAGHGLGASMLTTLVHAHLVALLTSKMLVQDAIAATNRYLAQKSTSGRFISLVVARITPDGLLTLVDAGHAHWVHLASGKCLSPRRAKSVPLGIDADAVFEPETKVMSTGDRLILYTDGITEQSNPEGVHFGAKRLHEILHDSERPHQDVTKVISALEGHAAGGFIEDDATIASIQFTKSPAETS